MDVAVTVKGTKDVDVETILAYGLFCFYAAVADAVTDLVATTVVDVETAASGLSFYCSAVADVAMDLAATTVVDVAMDLETAAANLLF